MKEHENQRSNQTAELETLQSEIEQWEITNDQLSTKMQELQNTQQSLLQRKVKAIEECKKLQAQIDQRNTSRTTQTTQTTQTQTHTQYQGDSHQSYDHQYDSHVLGSSLDSNHDSKHELVQDLEEDLEDELEDLESKLDDVEEIEDENHLSEEAAFNMEKEIHLQMEHIEEQLKEIHDHKGEM